MAITLRLVVGVVSLLWFGGVCIWRKDSMWKWEVEIRQYMGNEASERTPKWERDSTLTGIIAISLAVLLMGYAVVTYYS